MCLLDNRRSRFIACKKCRLDPRNVIWQTEKHYKCYKRINWSQIMYFKADSYFQPTLNLLSYLFTVTANSILSRFSKQWCKYVKWDNKTLPGSPLKHKNLWCDSSSSYRLNFSVLGCHRNQCNPQQSCGWYCLAVSLSCWTECPMLKQTHEKETTLNWWKQRKDNCSQDTFGV